jgi:membrane protease YdiL (CAAX protease family)
VAAFLAGHQLYAVIYPLLPARFVFPFRAPHDWVGFAVARLAYGVSILAVCLPVWWLVYRRQQLFPPLALGHGDWSVRGRDTFAKEPPSSWGRRLATGYLIFAAIFFLLMQVNVGFEPVRSGAILPFLPAICGAALANATAEELVFRGVLQPAFVRYGGIAAGVWMQGLLFGLLHWGNSVGVLAALPVSMLIGLGSVIWGKAALETGGLTWVIIAHALLDVGVMSAFFVPRVGP